MHTLSSLCGTSSLMFPCQGDFVDNEYHGTGVYTWPDGSRYTGEFSHNRYAAGSLKDKIQ